jgi:hypothetical protein
VSADTWRDETGPSKRPDAAETHVPFSGSEFLEAASSVRTARTMYRRGAEPMK